MFWFTWINLIFFNLIKTYISKQILRGFNHIIGGSNFNVLYTNTPSPSQKQNTEGYRRAEITLQPHAISRTIPLLWNPIVLINPKQILLPFASSAGKELHKYNGGHAKESIQINPSETELLQSSLLWLPSCYSTPTWHFKHHRYIYIYIKPKKKTDEKGSHGSRKQERRKGKSIGPLAPI